MADKSIEQNKWDHVFAPALEAAQKGEVPPWKRGWAISGRDAARQFLTGWVYEGGVNCFSLAFEQMSQGFQYSLWVPRSSVFPPPKPKKGQKPRKDYSIKGLVPRGTSKELEPRMVYILRPMLKKVEVVDAETGEKKIRQVFYGWGQGKVFNVELLEDTSLKKKHLDRLMPELEAKEVNPIDSAEQVLREMKDPPKVVLGKDRACYFPAWDTVHMPSPEQFVGVSSVEEYYGTYFHEFAHSTGHEKRLARAGVTGKDWNPHRHEYGYEELVAEFGAAIVLKTLGIETREVMDNTMAYLANWTTKLKANPHWFFHAVQEGEKAARWIMNLRKERAEHGNSD